MSLPISLENIVSILVFGPLALVAIGSAVGMLVSKHAIYSALFLVLNFATVALLYLVLGAPFIALTQITVYAGAIVVLFLFVIMLLGAETLPAVRSPERSRHMGAAIALGVIFLLETVLVVFLGRLNLSGEALPVVELGSPAAIGMTLFVDYPLAFEVTSLILLVGIIGAITLVQRTPRRGKDIPDDIAEMMEEE